MSEEKKRILEMLAQGKINTDEAERLLSALSNNEQI
jgi:polyhydroxyalkanoate synthesis regulator phasin